MVMTTQQKLHFQRQYVYYLLLQDTNREELLF